MRLVDLRPDATESVACVVSARPLSRRGKTISVSLDVSALAPPPGALAEEVTRSLRGLSDGLDASDIPAKRLDDNLLIATWNVRAFGGLTEKWRTEARDRPKRNLHDLHAIAEIVSRFDVMAIQEAREELTALRYLMRMLGPSWGLTLTDVTWGEPGNGERMAFVFDLRRVKPSGLACELVVPEEWLAASEEDARANDKIRMDGLYRQFARTPYAVSFESAGQQFVLVALHVWYGKKAKEREPELRAIARWLARWAGRGGPYEQNFIALGDFNIDRKGDPNWEAFASEGLRAPDELDEALRTVTDKPGDPNFYDQIAWFHENGRAKLSLTYTGRAGTFDWTQHLLEGVDETEKTWRISDHFPLWAEFSVRS
jgi:endonuclease/exonuclease/phosphatase family metal-dependent hydrolase